MRKRLPATELYRLRREGWSIGRLAAHFGVTAPGVYLHLKRNAPELVQQRKKIRAIGCCEICKVETLLDSDHDHLTGKRRGLLCRRCNQGLGNFTDSVAS